jgi:class 3 adenylate cyclase
MFEAEKLKKDFASARKRLRQWKVRTVHLLQEDARMAESESLLAKGIRPFSADFMLEKVENEISMIDSFLMVFSEEILPRPEDALAHIGAMDLGPRVEEAEQVERVVLTFDICGSTVMVEDLARSYNLPVVRDLFIYLKNWLENNLPSFEGEICNFTGDGWILLFPTKIHGNQLLSFILHLALQYAEFVEEKIKPRMESLPSLVGISFGAARGNLVRFEMFERIEYVGRPINVACRLQAAIKNMVKESGKTTAYKLCVPGYMFEDMFREILEDQSGSPNIVSERHEERLPNIINNQAYRCFLLDLAPVKPR